MTPQPTPSSGRKDLQDLHKLSRMPILSYLQKQAQPPAPLPKVAQCSRPAFQDSKLYARAPVEVVRSREFHEQTRFICELSGPGGGPSRSSQTQRIRLPKIESRSSGIRCFDQGRTAWLTPQRFYGHSCRGGPGQPGLARKETL